MLPLAIAVLQTLAAVDAALPPSTATPPPAAPAAPELWVGHEVLLGSRRVPVLGNMDTRTDNYILAEVRRRGDALTIRHHACRVEVAAVFGVEVTMSPAAVARLPATTVQLTVGEGGVASAPVWTSGWDREDLDGDGKPGVTVSVDAPMCDGDVYVSSRSWWSLGKNHVDAEGFYGDETVRVRQRTLDATSSCLLWGKREIEQVQRGRFLFRRVAAGTTCATLSARPWPVHAEAPKR